MKWTLPSRREIRHANFGIAIAAVVLLVGVLIFKDAGESALEIVGIVGFVSAFVVAHALDAIASSRESREGRESQ
jgi:hypothetical protein